MLLIVFKFGAQFFKSNDMGIQSPTANFVSTWFGNIGTLKSRQHGPCQHNRTT